MILGDATGDEETVPIDMGIEWDAGAPMPVLMQSDYKAYLALYLADGGEAEDRVAVIEWRSCHGAVLGGLNDEAIHGHRLWKRGLREALQARAAEVRNSAWIAAEERANRVHPYHDPASYAKLRHYILLLKDSTFECLAQGYSVSTRTEPMPTALAPLIPELAT